jgi:hypothetical protein
MLAYVPYLTNREEAILFWAVAIAVFVIVVGRTELGQPLRGVLGALFTPKLLLLFMMAAAYCGIFVLVAHQLGVWHTSAVKETLYWFFGSGTILVGGATRALLDDPDFFDRLPRIALRTTLVIEFLVNVYGFSFWIEVPLVGIALALALAQADRVLMLLGGFLLLYVAVQAITNLDGLLTRENGETLLIAPALAFAFVPFLHLVARFSKWDADNARRRPRVGLRA